MRERDRPPETGINYRISCTLAAPAAAGRQSGARHRDTYPEGSRAGPVVARDGGEHMIVVGDEFQGRDGS
jgi:hypothetical protein